MRGEDAVLSSDWSVSFRGQVRSVAPGGILKSANVYRHLATRYDITKPQRSLNRYVELK